ncbi:MAG: sulfotransferase [Pacificimonas sp.]|nr:sulfotransferase [Pacificimonas sp.]
MTYSYLDRAIHRIAFAHPIVQRSLNAIETDLFAKDLPLNAVDRPVFVTALPRAGTTLVLNLLYGTGAFASYTYRHMPFPMAPLFWSKATGGARKAAVETERKHGDGMAFGFDSPEAFEEVLWLNLLGDKIRADDHLRALSAEDVDEDSADVLRATIAKLLHAESGERRYLSKNNANVSRLPAVRSVFPGARIIVPFRDPFGHVGSLQKQHDQFLALHGKDRFAEDYMRWLGHHDFGANFLPLGFEGIRKPEVADTEFWLTYWCAAYEHVLADGDVFLADYEALCAEPVSALAALAAAADIPPTSDYLAQADGMRNATSRPADRTRVSAALLKRAETIHQELKVRAGAMAHRKAA